MIKKTVTYTNMDNEEVTQDLYFHLSVKDLMALKDEMGEESEIEDFLKRMINEKSAVKKVESFDMLVARAYGIRDPVTDKHDKTGGVGAAFIDSLAYDALWADLASDPEAVDSFFSGLIPAKLLEQAKKKQVSGEITLPFSSPPPQLVKEELPWENRDATDAELMTMSPDQLLEYYARKRNKPS